MICDAVEKPNQSQDQVAEPDQMASGAVWVGVSVAEVVIMHTSKIPTDIEGCFNALFILTSIAFRDVSYLMQSIHHD
jgi:hypothetical protein